MYQFIFVKTLLCPSLISNVHCHTWERLQQPQEQCYSILPVYVIFQYLLTVMQRQISQQLSIQEISDPESASLHIFYVPMYVIFQYLLSVTQWKTSQQLSTQELSQQLVASLHIFHLTVLY